MSPIEELDAWIEGERAGWRERGVVICDRDGQKIFRVFGSDGHARAEERGVLIGTVKGCTAEKYDPAEFVPLIVLGEMSVEHAKVLIENAVERVAGR